METTRRQFLSVLAGVPLLSATGRAAPLFLRLARAAGRARGTAPRALVVLRLQGGNDGLNTVVPFRADPYYRRRRSLALAPGAVRRITDELAFHPEMSGLEALFKEGRLAVVQGVGYPGPDRSHFRSTEIWESADVAGGSARAGWLGRCLCHPGAAGDSILGGAALGTSELPQALVADPLHATALASLEEFRLPAGVGSAVRDLLPHLAAEARGDAGSTLERVRETIAQALDASARLPAEGRETTASYPDLPLARTLREVAALHRAGLGTRVFFVTLDGFDTHARQARAHGLLLAELSRSVKAFLDDLALDGAKDEVLLVTVSEFGRRVEENGSGGTDHGAAAPLFVAGGGVKGGVHGAHPSLERLADGDLEFGVDFRSVYATVLRRWLGVDPAPVLGGSFAELDFV
jgi:uncharacterized protein (DUF1501 family)